MWYRSYILSSCKGKAAWGQWIESELLRLKHELNWRRSVKLTKYWFGSVSVGKHFQVSIAPCKGIQDILGFWIPRCGFWIPGTGFRILDSGFQHSGFRIPKRAGFQLFTVLMLFFAFRFRVRILVYWKTLLECITSLFSFSIYKLRVECITVP